MSKEIKYTKENMIDLIKSLKAYGNTYWSLHDFLEHHFYEGNFDYGFSNYGTLSSAVVMEEFTNLFPDALFALFMPAEDLPLYINQTSEIMLEYPIACWRLQTGK